jgi:CubicO group peptidase (beta-lactamase class C family)
METAVAKLNFLLFVAVGCPKMSRGTRGRRGALLMSHAAAVVVCLVAVFGSNRRNTTAAAAQGASSGGGGCDFLPLQAPSVAALQAQGLWAGVDAALQDVGQLVQAAADNHSGTGFAVVVSYRGETVLQTGAGVARLLPNGSAVAPDADRSVWRLGSLTKLFTALLLARRVDEAGSGSNTTSAASSLSYDTPLSDLIPGFAPVGATPAQVRGVTLGALAGQLGGIVREPPRPCLVDQSDCNVTTAEMLPSVNALPLLWAPGVRPSYSNLVRECVRGVSERVRHWLGERVRK